ncbi:hypothetical protein [Tetragenococcus halophilus]|uniref:Uncharacterized protein n=1 Tax=Tetragenococcus halophilus TaxID=51669 RepID=A0AB35HRR0_TETHA|nr:hypothetical protein [Tetragenococcus halophilus]MCO8296234.1 hypothetical protein [Tetragenococcus halophilus]MCO8298783.1 hypothetical protein [Tetragenococcus halophilus]GFK25269.1 hypothetical protein YA163_23320 [Tetragenococcus halophilus]
MAKNNIEKQKERLEKIEEQIKREKQIIDSKLGSEFFKAANIDYSELGRSDIKPFAEELAKLYNDSRKETSVNSFDNEYEPKNEV